MYVVPEASIEVANLPPPIRTSDAGSFDRYTFVERIPGILREALAQTDWRHANRKALEALHAEVTNGRVYWSASRGILLRTASKKWKEEKKAYFIARAKEYFSKVKPGDDLRSIAALDLGMLCLDGQEWTEAEENLADALRSFPDDKRISEGIVTAHLELGNKVEALSMVDTRSSALRRLRLYGFSRDAC